LAAIDPIRLDPAARITGDITCLRCEEET